MTDAQLTEKIKHSSTKAATVFIDGEHGTTGLQIRERLSDRPDIELLSLSSDDRRNDKMRAELVDAADVVILCLPDDAARDTVARANERGNRTTRFIDASTAHRTADGWAYGFAELTKGQRQRIAEARNVSNPGCYSTGAIALLRPLVEAGLLATDYPVTINAISGYTGGGKNLIAQMEDGTRPDAITANYFLYALGLSHKHLPEIVARAGLTRQPVFTPGVGRFPQGMLVNLPLHADLLAGKPGPEGIHAALESHYAGARYVDVAARADVDAMVRVDPEEMVGTDRMKLYVFHSPDGGLLNLVASLDNLGKGASGAAVQNLEIMLGL